MEPRLAVETVEIGADELAVLHADARVVNEVGHTARGIDLIIGAVCGARFRFDDLDAVPTLLYDEDAGQPRIRRSVCDIEFHRLRLLLDRRHGLPVRRGDQYLSTSTSPGREQKFMAVRLRLDSTPDDAAASLSFSLAALSPSAENARPAGVTVTSTQPGEIISLTMKPRCTASSQIGQPRTRCAPGFHHLRVGPRSDHQPFNEVEDQGIEPLIMIVAAHARPQRVEWQGRELSRKLRLSVQCIYMIDFDAIW